MYKKVKNVLWLIVPALVLAGCSDEEEQQRLTIQNFDIIDTYDYDRVKVVVEDEKTPEELAYEVLMDSMGLNSSQQDGYREVGIDEGNGVFINAGILEGNRIPTVSGYSAEDVMQVNNGQEQSEAVKLEQFQELQRNREYKVSVYDEEAVLKETADRIRQATMEQELRIQEQLEQREMQELEGGSPEFNIENIDSDGNIDAVDGVDTDEDVDF